MPTLQNGPQALSELAIPSEGAIVSRMLLKAAGGSVTLFAFAAGEGLSEHATPHDALVMVTSGEAHIAVEEQVLTVRAGEVIRLPASVPHAVQAPVDVRLVLVILRG